MYKIHIVLDLSAKMEALDPSQYLSSGKV